MSPRLALLPVLLLPALPAPAGSAPPEQEAGHHEIRLRLDPATSSLRGSDRHVAPFRSKQGFRLGEGLELDAVRCGDKDLLGRVRPDRKAAAPGHWELRVPRACAGDDGMLSLDFEFHGVFDDEPGAGSSFVTGAGGAGLISEQGVFLSADAGFHPDFGEMARFDLTVDVPAGWAVASQGRVGEAEGEAGEGRALFAFEAELPSDGLALSAGPYHVSERRHGDTLLRTFFFEDDEERAALVLDAVARSLDRFVARLGPYPHSKFDLVENVFTTGSGFPGYALFGKDGIGKGPRGLRPGHVDRALAQGWWGNAVHVNPDGGSWSEGLTAYLAGDLAAEDQGAARARAERRRVAQRYALAVPADADIPASEFRGESGDAATAIGHGKVALIVHQLRRELGDELFWTGLRALARSRLGQRTSWSDIRSSFEASSERELGAFFSQWLERPGLPQLRLGEVREEDGRVTGTLLQDGEAYALRPELRVSLRDGQVLTRRLATETASTAFAVDVPGPVATVELDPDWHLPGRVEAKELPHSLSRTLAAESLGHALRVAYPIAPPDAPAALKARARTYRELAEEAVARHGGEALPALAVADAEWNASSLVLLGGPDENPLAKRIVDDLARSGIDVSGHGFRAGTRRWRDDGDSLLVSLPHPDRAGASVSLWMPNGESAVESGRSLFDHGWDSWVALRDGRARERGTVWPDSPDRRRVLAAPARPDTAPARLRATVERLERPELEGRNAGTAASRRTAAEIEAAMDEAGLEPWDPRGFQQVFFWYLRDMPRGSKLYRQRKDRRSQVWDCVPAAYGLPVPESLMTATGSVEVVGEPVLEPILIPIPEGLVHAGTIERPAFRGLDLRGSAAVLVDDTPLPGHDRPEARRAHERERSRRYMDLLEEVRRQEGDTLLVIRPRDEAPFFPLMTSYASLEADRDPEIAAAHRAGGLGAAARAVSARHASVPAPPAPVRLVFAGADLLEAMKAEAPLEPGKRYWQGLYLDLRMRLETRRVFDRNLIGLTLGQRKLSEGVVIVGAHHDGPGLATDGTLRDGAVDNAAGTAVLLELARRFGEDPPPLTVAFVSFGAKEWGLIGSRSLVEAWPEHWPVRAVVNVDGVGRTGAALQVTGESREPAIADLLHAAAGERGFVRGAGRDRSDDRDGSDHWPWAKVGLPAVTIGDSLEGSGAEVIDYETLGQLADALEVSIRRLASGADS